MAVVDVPVAIAVEHGDFGRVDVRIERIGERPAVDLVGREDGQDIVDDAAGGNEETETSIGDAIGGDLIEAVAVLAGGREIAGEEVVGVALKANDLSALTASGCGIVERHCR